MRIPGKEYPQSVDRSTCLHLPLNTPLRWTCRHGDSHIISLDRRPPALMLFRGGRESLCKRGNRRRSWISILRRRRFVEIMSTNPQQSMGFIIPKPVTRTVVSFASCRIIITHEISLRMNPLVLFRHLSSRFTAPNKNARFYECSKKLNYLVDRGRATNFNCPVAASPWPQPR